jgi:hypothetical protein
MTSYCSQSVAELLYTLDNMLNIRVAYQVTFAPFYVVYTYFFMQEENLAMPTLSTRNATSNRNWNINLFLLDFSPMEEDLIF